MGGHRDGLDAQGRPPSGQLGRLRRARALIGSSCAEGQLGVVNIDLVDQADLKTLRPKSELDVCAAQPRAPSRE
jgi:hypothetical protein